MYVLLVYVLARLSVLNLTQDIESHSEGCLLFFVMVVNAKWIASNPYFHF